MESPTFELNERLEESKWVLDKGVLTSLYLELHKFFKVMSTSD
jgi:hypothetical protein